MSNSTTTKAAAAIARINKVDGPVDPEPEFETAGMAQATEPVDSTPVAMDWSLIDDKWVKVPASTITAVSRDNGKDPFYIPESITGGDNAAFDFIHGSTEQRVAQRLRGEGFVPFVGKAPAGVESRGGVPHVLGPDAPLYYRPKSVAHRYKSKSTEDYLEQDDKDTRDKLSEIMKEWSRQDRTIDSSPDAIMSPNSQFEILEKMGDGDRTAGAMLRSERQQKGLGPTAFERNAEPKSQFQIPLTDGLEASIRQYVEKILESRAS